MHSRLGDRARLCIKKKKKIFLGTKKFMYIVVNILGKKGTAAQYLKLGKEIELHRGWPLGFRQEIIF